MIHSRHTLIQLHKLLAQFVIYRHFLFLQSNFLTIFIYFELYYSLILELSLVVEVQSIMRHVVQNFQSHNEAVLRTTDLSREIEDTSVKDLDLVPI